MGGLLGNPFLTFWSNAQWWDCLFFFFLISNLALRPRDKKEAKHRDEWQVPLSHGQDHGTQSKQLKGNIHGPSWVVNFCKFEPGMTRFPIFSREVGSLVFDLESIFLKSLAHSQLSPNTEAPESWWCSLHSDLPSAISGFILEYLHHKNSLDQPHSFEMVVKHLPF